MSRAVVRRGTATWLALLCLTGTSYGLSYAHLGPFGVPVALGIAAVKVSLVALVFMELQAAPYTVRATLVIAFAFVGILVFFVAADVATRAPAPMLVPGTLDLRSERPNEAVRDAGTSARAPLAR